MKKVILSIVIAVVSLLNSFSAQADNASIQMKGDSMVVVNGKDTVTITLGKLKEFATKINNRLDDTIVDNAIDAADAAIAVTDAALDDSTDKNEIALAQIHKQNADHEKIFIATVTAIVFGTIFLIVLISLIVYYMRRRAKYRIVEKAIENGYPLPDSFYGNRPVMPQPIMMPQQPFAPQQPVTPQQPNAPQQPNFDLSSCDAIYSRLRWHRGARSGFKLGIIGLAFLIFACMISEEFFAAVGFIFLLIGAAKLAIAYFDTRVPAVPQQPVTPQAPATPQQPVTPPPFNDERASSTNDENKV